MQASAIVFQAPLQLSVRTLALRPPEPDDLEVEVLYSGISTGTERLLWDGSMPAFPGMGYPLVPGYETVGVVRRAPKDSPIREGETVFVPGSYSFDGVHNLFGGAGSMLRAKASRVVRVQPTLGHRAVLLALAATAYHAVSLGGKGDPATPPDLIIGHGVVGRLLARLTVAAALRATSMPARVEPVIEIMSMSGCEDIAAPTVGPSPKTRLNTPGGRPAASMISARICAENGAISEGLRITVQPTASAGAVFAHI
jgi:3-hydroxyethyl bacteriochlorophyllide a dehydrogenase